MCAVVPKRGEAIDVDELRRHLAEHIASFKIPTIWDLRDEPLPRNASGKILKRGIRDELVARRGA